MKILFLSLVLFVPSLSFAAEVVKFRPRPAEIEVGDDTLIGILISEEEFTKIVEEKLRTNTAESLCTVDRKVCAATQKLRLIELDKLREELTKSNSWFRRNKGSLGIVTGLIIGVATSIGIARAIKGE